MQLWVIEIGVPEIPVRGIPLGRDIDVATVEVVKDGWRLVEIATLAQRVWDVRSLGMSLVIELSFAIQLRILSSQVHVVVLLLLKWFWFTGHHWGSDFLNVELGHQFMHVVFKIFQVFMTILVFYFSSRWLFFQKLLLLNFIWRFRYFLLLISTYLYKIILDRISSFSTFINCGLMKILILISTSLCLAPLSIIIAPIVLHVTKRWSLFPAWALVVAPTGW